MGRLRRELLAVNPRNYAVYSEGYVDEITRLRAEMDEYLGLPCRLLPENPPQPVAEQALAPPPVPEVVRA